MLGEQLSLIDTLDETPSRVLCNGVKRECVRTTPVLASRLFCNSALHTIRYGVLDEAIERVSREIEPRLDPPPDPSQGPEHAASQVSQQQATSSQMEPAQVEPRQEGQRLSWKEAVILLDSIPGINQRAAEGILAEIGIDMSRFPTAAHLASWAGMCPGHHESAGQRLSGKTRKGSPWLRKLLVEAAHAAAHSKNTYLAALYYRVKARGGGKKAMLAVGQAILVAISHMLDRSLSYQELGGNYFDEHDRQHVEKRLVRRLENLGYQVSLGPVA